MNVTSSAIAALALFGAVSTPVQAHDLWLTWKGDANRGHVLLHYGHPSALPPPSAEKVVAINAVTAKDKFSLLKGLRYTLEQGHSVVETSELINLGPLLITARYDNGFWTTTASGENRNLTRRSVPNPRYSVWSAKSAKLITGVGSAWQTVVGDDLELVPLSDPAAARPGDILKVKVLFDGAPLPRVRVGRTDGETPIPEDEIPRFEAGPEGIAEIKIEQAGPQLLLAERAIEPSLAPDQASMDVYNATLYFTVK